MQCGEMWEAGKQVSRPTRKNVSRSIEWEEYATATVLGNAVVVWFCLVFRSHS